MSAGEKDWAGSKAAADEFAASLASIKLRPPVLPQGGAALPEEAGRKYPLFQELAAMGQEIQDEFSRGRLELADISARLEGEILALSPARPEAKPAAEAEIVQAPVSMTKPLPAGQALAPAVPAAGGRSWLAPVIISVAALFAAALFLFPRSGPVSSFPLPPTRASGLCLDPEGRRLFFADPQRQLLFTVSAADGRVVGVQAFPAAGLKALAYDGSVFWSSDGAALFRHGQAGGYAALEAYKDASGALFLCWDGKNLWSAGADGELLRYTAGDPPKRAGEFGLPGGQPAGIAVSDGKLWLFDRGSGKLAVYTIGARPELLAEAGLGHRLPGGAVTGFALGGNYAWLVTENPPQLLRVDLKELGLLK